MVWTPPAPGMSYIFFLLNGQNCTLYVEMILPSLSSSIEIEFRNQVCKSSLSIGQNKSTPKCGWPSMTFSSSMYKKNDKADFKLQKKYTYYFCLVLLQLTKCFGLVQIFCARPKIYLRIVNCGSHKHFVPDKKMIFIQ